MSEFNIQDGTGQGYYAKVDAENRLVVHSTSLTEISYVSSNQQTAFIIATDFIPLTVTGSFNAVIYVKNNSANPFFIEAVRSCQTNSGHAQWKMFRNPTTGSIVAAANDANVGNMNFNSSKTFSANVYTGGDNETFANGTHFTQWTNKSPGHSTQTYGGALILEKGGSLGIVVKPSAPGDICIEIQGRLEESS
jgi:hypothetical protein